MKIQNVIMELEAIESVKNELKQVENNTQAYEVLGRLVNLYSALNVKDLREFLESSVGDQKAA